MRAIDAATNMKITAQDLLAMKVIDEIIAEPVGGAHRDVAATIETTGKAIERAIQEFDGQSADEIRAQRQDRFLEIGRSLS